jgi:myo-inositol catabolism protein IolH
VKVALDPLMLRHQSLTALCRVAAEVGFKYIELSPREDFLPSGLEPRAGADSVHELKQALRENQVELASLWTVYRWSEPDDESVRELAVRYWKKALELAVELGCRHVNSELSGSPDSPAKSRSAFLRSMDELIPVLEREGLTMSVEAHPGDFIEKGDETVDLLGSLGSAHVRYLFCAPHTFHLGNDMVAMLQYAAPVLAHVHVADTFDHTQPLRYILNPAGSTARIHQHLNIGEGEIDWEAFFRTLSAIGFDGILTSSVFAWQEKAIESSRFMRERIEYFRHKYPS